MHLSAEQGARLPGEPVAAGDLDRLGQTSRRGQQQREGEVRGRRGQHLRGVTHGDPAAGGRSEVDVVDADRVVRDRDEPRGGLDQRSIDPVGQQRQHAIGSGRLLAQDLVGRWQPLRPDDGLVQRPEPVERGSGKLSGHEHARHRRDSAELLCPGRPAARAPAAAAEPQAGGRG